MTAPSSKKVEIATMPNAAANRQGTPKALTLGVDLGGTKVETALVDSSGAVVATHRHPTHSAEGPAAVVADIVACVTACVGSSGATAVSLGIGVAGQVDAASGTVRFAPNLGWRDVPLRAQLEEALGLPVAVTNDVRAATWGEWHHGAGRGVRDLVVLFVGTGIGGGVVSDGRMLEGFSNTAGEVGHMTVVVDGRPCRCTNRGCLEAYAGGWAIAERAREAARRDAQAGAVLAAMAGSVEAITAETVSQAHAEGDPFARALVAETGAYLAGGLVSIVNAFNPRVIVLGGGVIEGLPDLVSSIAPQVRSRALGAAAEHLEIARSTLGGVAVVLGAAALARELVRGAPHDSPSR